MSWLIPRNELTSEQLRAIGLSTTEHRVVFGAPGSGKTQILLHRTRYLCDINNGPSAKFHIFVFNNVLKSYIKSALDLLNLPEKCVSTLDAWCANFYRKHIGGRMPWNAEGKCPDFTAIRKAVLDKVDSGNPRMLLYDFVMVDEGQDLDSTSFEILSRISKHITVCIDHKQKIYEKGLDENGILTKLGLRRRNMTLLDAFRCCPYIVHLGSRFIENDEDRDAYIRQSRTEQSERETPVLYFAVDFDDEKQRLIELVKTRLAKNEKIAVIVPQNRQVYGFAQGLIAAGLDVEWSGTYDFNSPKPKVLTYHSAKGLTFDTVIIPRLVVKSFARFSEAEIKQLLFVAITRAQKWVALISNRKTGLPQLAKLEPLVKKGFVTVQERSSSASEHRPSKDKDNEDSDLMDLL